MRRHNHSTLRVELRGEAVVIDAIEKLEARRMIGGHLEELRFDLQPRGARINADGLPRHARHADVVALLVADHAAKHRRHLQPSLVVDSGGGAASEASLLHFHPQKSTRIVSWAGDDVNHNLLIYLELRQTFARFSRGLTPVRLVTGVRPR